MLTILLIVLSVPGCATPTVLVDGGRGRCKIVVPDEHSEWTERERATIRTAAEDLAWHLEVMSGAKIPVVSDPSTVEGIPIHVGSLPEGARLPVDPNDESIFFPDGYLIAADVEKVILHAPRAEGVSNAVYGLLEDHLGCHWFIPGRIGAHIPKRSTVKLKIDGGHEVAGRRLEFVKPWGGDRPLAGADDDPSAPEVVDHGEWMRRNRHAGLRGYYGHYWYRIYTPELLAREPDLAPFFGGKRQPAVNEGNGQVCLSNPRAVDVAAKYYIDFFRDQPQWDFYSFSPNDGGGWCRCAECNAMASNDAGRTVILANRVLERVAKVHPHKKLAFLIYNQTFDPPEDGIRPHPNLIGVICAAGMDGKAWMNQIVPKTGDHPDAVAYRRKVERWMTMLSSAWSHDYIGWFPGPFTMYRKRHAEHEYHCRIGVTGSCDEYLDRNMGTDIYRWLGVRCGWHRDLSVSDLLERFYPAYFGAAADDMRALYEHLEDHMATAETESSHGAEVSNVLGLYPLDLLDDALARIAVARAKVSEDELRWTRIKRDEWCLQMTRLFVESYGASRAYLETGDPKQREKAIAAADEFVRRHDRFDLPLRHALPRSARSLMEPLVFTKPGYFSIADHMGLTEGRWWRAVTWSGFRPGEHGLDLPPRTEGRIVYEARTAGDVKFKDAQCRLLGRGRIRIELSVDGG
ncbi:MAG: hypothetical protein CMJ18_00480, partial [Phycisphaeraceae bacterium]|nr:hypothetical protein [Phycisphaeraceae bacterium]